MDEMVVDEMGILGLHLPVVDEVVFVSLLLLSIFPVVSLMGVLLLLLVLVALQLVEVTHHLPLLDLCDHLPSLRPIRLNFVIQGEQNSAAPAIAATVY